MARGALLFNLMAESYARTPIADMKSYEKKLSISRKYLKPEHKVFEFGCGTGSTALLHAPYVQHIYSTDYAKKMIEIANRKKAEQGIDNVEFATGDITTLNIDRASYDVVLALNILHLMEDVETAIHKSWETLKPGGYFISSSVCMSKPPGIWGLLIPLMGLTGLFPRLKGFSKKELLQFHTDTGFEILEQYDPDGDMPSVFLVAQKPAA